MMKKTTRMRKFSLILIVLMVFPLLAACGPKEPAVDPNMIYTQAAETVAAQMAETLAAQPPATATPEPTATQEELPTATATVAMVPTFTPNAGAATVASLPTSTKIATGGGDKAQWAYSSPADGATLAPAVVFQLAIGLLNTGSTTWTQDYKLVYTGGTQICSVTSLSHDPAGGDKNTIPPGDKAEFIMLCTAPAEPGEYISYWVFNNPSGGYIYDMYFAYTVE